MKSFYVFLPSNVKDLFNKNTTFNFITHLSSTLRLNENWEVGLSEISFIKSWYNVQRDFEISISTDSGLSFNEPNLNLKAGSYESFDDILYLINATLSYLTDDAANTVRHRVVRYPTIRLDKFNKKITFITGELEKQTVIIPILENDLMNMFGFKESVDKKNTYISENEIIEEASIVKNDSIKGDVISDRVSDINAGVDSLFVYCSIIKPTFVGDTLSKLIRVVQVPSCTFGTPIQKIYDSPHYFPISSREINYIEIDIKDDTGENIKFNSGKVVIVLHFKEK